MSKWNGAFGLADLEDDIIPTCKELGIGVVAYSPLGRGESSKISNHADCQCRDSTSLRKRACAFDPPRSAGGPCRCEEKN